ncbi:MAG: glycosyltransferase family 4 protein, partial [Burkholderiaceae bacterium]
RAYAQRRVDLPFSIAGTRPAEPQLRALAQQTPGVVLKGYLPESALVAAYRRAVFVPFAPYQEDYGLITVEAFMAGAPVLTTTDAGGPTELVVHGKTGWVAEPTEASLAEGFRALVDSSAADYRQRMGEAGRQWVAASLSWSALAKQLVHRPEPAALGPGAESRPNIPASRSVMPRSVRRLLVVNSFAVEAAASGGQLRIQGLYTALSRYLNVHLLDLGHSQTAHTLRQHTEGFIEETLPMPSVLCQQEAEYFRQLGVSCLDLLVALRPELLTEFSMALARCLRDCDVVVFSHPYCFPVYESLVQREPGLARPIVYEAHNVESHLKAAMYAKGG